MAERKIILILSGEIGSGKTTLAKKLASEYGFQHSKTNERLKYLADKKKIDIKNRDDLQLFGAKLDKEDNGKWVRVYFQEKHEATFQENNYYLVDSARILGQITHFRDSYSHAVVHVHLKAPSKTLEERYIKREQENGKSQSRIKDDYKHFKNDPTEKQVNTLENEADLVIDTDRCNEGDVLTRVASFLKLLPPLDHKLVDVLVGGQFGSEGKGQIAAYVAPEYDCLVRVGGPNAGHTVYEEPDKHVFHLLPSGSHRNQTAKLILAPGAVLNADKLLNEITYYLRDEDSRPRLIIDENAVVITQEDIENEKAIQKHISSTAQGVGFATANNIIERLNKMDKHKAKNNPKLKPYIGDAQYELQKLFASNKKILLEGTQGTALSLYHGMYPYVTSRDTSVSGCLSEIGISPMRVRKVIMVTRTYPIRVGGTSGDFGSNEITWDEVAKRSDKNSDELKKKEITTTTKKDRRVAEFSWSMFRKACEINSPTDIALTFADYLSIKNENARRYEQLTSETKMFIEELERCSGVKTSLIGTGFGYRAVIDRRNWR